jgi:hypothetical protein
MSEVKDQSGPPSKRTARLAVWLLGHLRDGQPRRLHDLINAAGDLGFVGALRLGEDGRFWSNTARLFRAKDSVPNLMGPDAGWMVKEARVDGKTFWQAIPPASNPSKEG